MMNSENLLWTGLGLFVIFLFCALYLYFEAERFDLKFLRKIELVRKVKVRTLLKKVRTLSQKLGPTEKIEEGKSMELNEKEIAEFTRYASGTQLWYDYPVMAKEFLIGSAFWVFVLGYAIIQVCLLIYFELEYFGSYYTSYGMFCWLLCIMKLYQNLSQYRTVIANIERYIDALRMGERESL